MSTYNKKAESLSQFQVVTSALAQGNYDFLLLMGFDWDEIHYMTTLNAEELSIFMSSDKLLNIQLRVIKKDFTLLKRRVDDHREESRMIDEYIMLGAHQPMLSTLFGITKKDYCLRAKLLEREKLPGIKKAGGRPSAPNEDTVRKAWLLWNEFSDLEPRIRYLQIGRKMNTPLCEIWAVMKDWEEETRALHSRNPNPVTSSVRLVHSE